VAGHVVDAPRVAREYYNGQANSFLRQAMRTTGMASRAERAGEPKRVELPMPVRTLYDVFVHICADEAEHVSTMRACQDSSDDLRPLAASFPAAGEYTADDEIAAAAEDSERGE
jgi:hypothetical protein